MQLWKVSSRGSGVKSMTVTDQSRRARKFEQIIAKSSGLKTAALEQPRRGLAGSFHDAQPSHIGRSAMKAVTEKDTIRTITTHYIDGAFVESHGREVMDIIKPTNGQLIGRVTLGDEEDTRRAIAAAKRAFASFG